MAPKRNCFGVFSLSEAAVAEAPETLTPVSETPQVETPVVETPAPVGDTGQPQAADAAPASDDAALEASYAAFRQEQESKESGEPAPEPAQREPEQPQIDPRVYQARGQDYKRAYDSFYGIVDSSVQEMVESGLPESQAKRIAESLKQAGNTIHATGLNFHGLEAATQTNARLNDAWNQNLSQAQLAFIPKSQHADFQKWFGETLDKEGTVLHSKWLDKAFELRLKADGYVSKSKYDADTKANYFAGARVHDAQRTDASSGRAISGGAGDSRSEDEILLDERTPIETVNAILARRRGG